MSKKKSDPRITGYDQEKPLERLHGLDGLRGLLALQVVAFHYLSQFPKVLEWARGNFLPVYNGNYAVCLFFLLSGFVMSYVYGQRLALGDTGPALKRFFAARAARLIPVQLLTLLVLFIGTSPLLLNDSAFLKPDTSLSLEGLIASAFSVQGPWFDRHSWNYPSWSISVEWHLYLLFPLMVWLFSLKRLSWQVLLAGVAAPSLYLLSRGGSGGAVPSTGGLSLLFALGLFVSGMAVHTVWRSRHLDSWLLAVAAIGLAIVGISVRGWFWIALLASPLLLLAILRNETARAVFGCAPMRFLGAISFSLYMSHAVFQMLVVNRPYYQRLFAGDDTSQWIGYLVSIALAVAIGTAVHYFFELPCRRLIASALKLRQPSAAAPALQGAA